MKALITRAALCGLLLCGHGQPCSAQDTSLLDALAKSKINFETHDLLVSSSTLPTVLSGPLPDDVPLGMKALEPNALAARTDAPVVAPHRQFLIFRRYDINVHDKAAPGSFDAKYLLVNGLHFATAMGDIALTQHCIANHTCREGNPLVPSSAAGAYSLEFGLASLGAVTSHFAKVGGSHLWFTTPLIGVGTHIIGIATGIQHF